jgi:hypothetical protein
MTRRLVQAACLVGAGVCVALFLRAFNYAVPQRSDALWLLALILWLMAVWLQPARSRAARILRLVDFGPLAVMLPLFVACWLPFHDNWRWAYTGDSFGIFGSGWTLGTRGLQQSLLSVHGIDNFYTYLWECSYNWPMALFGPTLFWHRVGQLIMACLALTAIYAFFCATLGRWWAVAIVSATATNYVWIWISYISYLRTDSFVFYYTTLLCGLLLWRTPRHLLLWACCGVIGGLALFYTPVTWGAVAAVAVVCGLKALRRQAVAGPLVYAISFLLVTIPILLELPWMAEMLRTQSLAPDAPSPWHNPRYVWETLKTIVISPLDSPIYILGVSGAFYRPPLGHLYAAGCVLALVGALPRLGRWLRIPPVAPLLLALYLCDAVLFSLTNKGYGSPSHKRFYNLIPLQIVFALLPFYVAHAWVGTRTRLRALIVVLCAGSIVTSSALGIRLIIAPRPHQYGYNVFDGVIELHQRFPDRHVVLFTDRHAEALAPGGPFDAVYGVAQRLKLKPDVDRQTLDETCRAGALFCYEIKTVESTGAPLIAQDARWQPFPLLNGKELRCYDCSGR